MLNPDINCHTQRFCDDRLKANISVKVFKHVLICHQPASVDRFGRPYADVAHNDTSSSSETEAGELQHEISNVATAEVRFQTQARNAQSFKGKKNTRGECRLEASTRKSCSEYIRKSVGFASPSLLQSSLRKQGSRKTVRHILVLYFAFIVSFFLTYRLPITGSIYFFKAPSSPRSNFSFTQPTFNDILNCTHTKFLKVVNLAYPLLFVPDSLVNIDSAILDIDLSIGFSNSSERLKLDHCLHNYHTATSSVRGTLATFSIGLNSALYWMLYSTNKTITDLSTVTTKASKWRIVNSSSFPENWLTHDLTHSYSIIHQIMIFLVPFVLHPFIPFHIPYSQPPPVISAKSFTAFQFRENWKRVDLTLSTVPTLIRKAGNLHTHFQDLQPHLKEVFINILHYHYQDLIVRSDSEARGRPWTKFWIDYSRKKTQTLHYSISAAKVLLEADRELKEWVEHIEKVFLALKEVQSDWKEIDEATNIWISPGGGKEKEWRSDMPMAHYVEGLKLAMEELAFLQATWSTPAVQ